MERGLFTPVHAATGERLRMFLSPTDIAKIERGPHWRAVVTDPATGTRYAARGAPCSIGDSCYCDAVVIELPEEESTDA